MIVTCPERFAKEKRKNKISVEFVYAVFFGTNSKDEDETIVSNK